MTREEVIEAAKRECEIEGWPWQEPIHVQRERALPFFGRVIWRVMTNSNMRGCNANLRFDDETGDVLKKALARR